MFVDFFFKKILFLSFPPFSSLDEMYKLGCMLVNKL
jgi:hypothetical protein